MAIKYDEKTKTYSVSYSKRHPITRQPKRAAREKIKSMAEAKRVYAELIIQIEDKLRETIVPKWRPLVEEFRSKGPDLGMNPKTSENYFVCLRAHTFELWGERFVDSITSDEIRALIKERVGHRSEGQQKNVHKFIRAVFRYACDIGVINRNPVPAMKFKVGSKIKQVLTEPQVGTLLNKAKEFAWEWYPHVAMALYTGMRNGELYALTWDKVSLEQRTILVDSSWNNKDGFKDTKSGDDRIVEIAPNLMPVLQELKISNSDSHFVLPRNDQWDEGRQAAALRMFLVGLGLPVVRFHDLRATWCTILLSKGIEPAKVMCMGGWKDLKTMMIYMRKAGIDIRGITDVLQLHNPSRTAAKVLEFEPRSSV